MVITKLLFINPLIAIANVKANTVIVSFEGKDRKEFVMKIIAECISKIVVEGLKKKVSSVDSVSKFTDSAATESVKFILSHTVEESAKALCTLATTGGCGYAGAELGVIVGTGIGFAFAGPLGATMGYTLGLSTGTTLGTIGGMHISRKLKTKFFDKSNTKDNVSGSGVPTNKKNTNNNSLNSVCQKEV